MSTKLLHDMCVPRTHFCLFSSPCKCMPVAKGSTVPTQIREASKCSKCLKLAFFTKHSGTRIWTTKQNTGQTDLLQERLHGTYNTYVHTDIPNPRGVQIHPSPCPMPPPTHFLSPHTRLHLPVSMLLSLTSGQQQPCPFPCSAPVRHLTTTLQQTFPKDEPEMSVAFGT